MNRQILERLLINLDAVRHDLAEVYEYVHYEQYDKRITKIERDIEALLSLLEVEALRRAQGIGDRS